MTCSPHVEWKAERNIQWKRPDTSILLLDVSVGFPKGSTSWTMPTHTVCVVQTTQSHQRFFLYWINRVFYRPHASLCACFFSFFLSFYDPALTTQSRVRVQNKLATLASYNLQDITMQLTLTVESCIFLFKKGGNQNALFWFQCCSRN